MQQRAHLPSPPLPAPAVAGVLVAAAAVALAGSACADSPGSAFARRLAWPPLVCASTMASDSAASAAPAPARTLGVRADRWQHASLSFALTAAAGASGAEPATAALATFALGVAKEVLDARTGRFDVGDLVADAAGALLAAVALDAITR